jgi:hypothetical protein
MDDDLVTSAYQQFGAWLEQRRHNIERERALRQSAAPPPANPIAASRDAALKNFRGMNDEQRAAAIERLRTARKGSR